MLTAMLLLTAGFVQGSPWAHFSRSPELGGAHEMVEIGTGERDGVPDYPYVLRLTRRARGSQPTTAWASSTTCPAIRPIIAGMARIAMPHPAPYGVPGERRDIVLDGTDYELGAPSTDAAGELTIRSNDGSALSAWVDDALRKLAGCWSPVTPQPSSRR